MRFEFSRKTKNIIFIVVCLSVILLGLFLTGIVTQLMCREETLTYNFFISVSYVFTHFKVSKFVLLVLFMVILAIVLIHFSNSNKSGLHNGGEYDSERNITYNRKGTYGTAKKLNNSEISNNFHIYNGWNEALKAKTMVLGYQINKNGKANKKKIVSDPFQSIESGRMYNKNYFVVGGAGSRKTRSFVMNYIIMAILRGESCIVADSKGDLYTKTAKYAEKKGYTVKILDFVEQQTSDGWAVLSDIKNDPELSVLLVDTIIQNTGGEKGDVFWDSAEQSILQAVVLFMAIGDVSSIAGEEYAGRMELGDVYKYIASTPLAELHTHFDVLQSIYPEHPALLPYSSFKRVKEDLQAQILYGLSVRLKLLQDAQIRKVIGSRGIDVIAPAESKCIYYLRFSDQVSTYEFLTSLFFSMMFTKLIAYADRQPDHRFRTDINFVLDECSNIGFIPDLDRKVSTIRSRGANTAIVVQSIPQFYDRYGENSAKEIMGNCDTTIYLGGNDYDTAEYFSNLSGDMTVSVASNSVMLGTAEIRETASTGNRKVYTPHEVRTLNGNNLLLFIRGINVVELAKIDYTDNPESKLFEEKLPSENRNGVGGVANDFSRMVYQKKMSVYGTQNNTSYQDTSSDSDSSYIDTDAYNATNSYSSQASSNSPSNGLSQPTTNRKRPKF